MRRVVSGCAVVLVLAAGCSDDGRELEPPTFPLPVTTTTTSTTLPPGAPVLTTAPPASSATLPSEPTASSAPSAAGRIEIDRLHSPANATAEMAGRGALAGDAVTVDGAPADVLSFDVVDDGFVVQVWIVDEGPHTVCVVDVCDRVYTLAPDAESAEEVIAKIESAIPLAQEYLDHPSLYPEWNVEIGGLLSGTGGTTDAATKTVTIYRNRGRSVDDYVRTVLHEFGHVVEAEHLDGDERAEYLEIREIDPSTPWRDPEAHRVEEWGSQPSEDFAEVMVMAWTDGRWVPRTEQLAPAPTPDQLAAITALLD